MNNVNAEKVGKALLQARASGASAALSSGEIEAIDLETGRSAQDYVTDTLKGPVAAWKVAVTPDGIVLSAPIHENLMFRHGARVPLSLCPDGGIECEIAFKMAKDFKPRTTPYSADEIASGIEHACVTAELLQSRLPAKYQSPRNAQLADLLSNAALVVGGSVTDWRPRDFKTIAVEFSADGKTVVARQGGHPTGDPFSGVVALANHLSSRGITLAAGQIVTAGSYTGVHFAPKGGRFRVRFDGFSDLEFEIA
jgi:2-keto-4-pentenoate hydratase